MLLIIYSKNLKAKKKNIEMYGNMPSSFIHSHILYHYINVNTADFNRKIRWKKSDKNWIIIINFDNAAEKCSNSHFDVKMDFKLNLSYFYLFLTKWDVGMVCKWSLIIKRETLVRYCTSLDGFNNIILQNKNNTHCATVQKGHVHRTTRRYHKICWHFAQLQRFKYSHLHRRIKHNCNRK